MIRFFAFCFAVASALLAITGCGTPSSEADNGFTDLVIGDTQSPEDGTITSDNVGHRDLPATDLPDINCGVTTADYFDRLIESLDGFYGHCSSGDRLNFWQRPANRRWMLEGQVRPVQAAYEVRFNKDKLWVDEAAACTYLALLKDGDCNATRTLSSGLVGDAGDGDACAMDEECPTGFFCRFPNTTVCEGACTAQVGEGQICDFGGCLPGYSCQLNASDEFRCMAKKFIRQPGQNCDAEKDVCAASFCDGSTCRELPGPGTTCSPGQFCKDGWCDRTLNICKPLIGLGADCQSWDTCEDGMYCLPFPEEKCQMRLDLGDECDPTRNSFDFPGVSLACASGLCDKVLNVCTTTPAAPACN
jgi:hypothetical protein